VITLLIAFGKSSAGLKNGPQKTPIILDKELLDLKADVLDLGSQLRSLVREDTAAHNRARNTTSSAEGDLGWNEHIRDVLFEEEIYGR
jgi:hypothetical protein